MDKVAIITDSVSTIPEQMAQEYGVKIVPLYVVVDGKDYPETEADRAQIYERLRRNVNGIATSSPPIGAYLKAYSDLSQQTKSILCITFTPSLGMAHSSAVQAAQIAQEEMPQANIKVINSYTAHSAQMLLVLAAARAASQGKSLNEISDFVNGIISRLNLLVLVPTPGAHGLAKEGRAVDNSNDGAPSRNGTQSIMEMGAPTGGVMKIFATGKNRREGMEKLLEIVKERNKDKSLKLAINYSDTYNEAEELRKKLISQLSCTESYLTADSLIPAIHLGLGAIPVAWYSEE
jgi:DegV family protein with EDD domain